MKGMGKVKSVRNKKSNHDILEEYLFHLEVADRSEYTIKSYLSILRRFLKDLPIPIQELTHEDVFEWLKTNGRDKKEKTVTLWISCLFTFFTFCKEEGYMNYIPIKNRWRPRIPEPIPRYLEREELAKVRMQSEKENLREQVLFEFLVSSGCRISEAVKLDKKDINIKERMAIVQGKGGKIRSVHFSDRCAILLKKHLKRLPENTGKVFINKNGNRLRSKYAHYILSNIGKRAGLKKPFGPHCLRHTFATELLSKGADLSFISEELGHSYKCQLSTTRLYARLPKEALVSMYRKFMG